MPRRTLKFIKRWFNWRIAAISYLALILWFQAGNYINELNKKRLLAEQNLINETPITDWFEVTKLVVPDFIIGDNPVIEYERTIKQEVKGTWNSRVLIYDADTMRYIYVCGNSDINNTVYRPQADLPDPVTWEWLVFDRRSCEVFMTPGEYRLVLEFTFCPEAMTICKNYRHMSNEFSVTRRDPLE